MAFFVGLVIYLKEQKGFSFDDTIQLLTDYSEKSIFNICHAVGYRYPKEYEERYFLKELKGQPEAEHIINTIYLLD